MYAKKLGRFTASLFVALGLALGGGVLAVTESSAATASPIIASLYRADIDWQ